MATHHYLVPTIVVPVLLLGALPARADEPSDLGSLMEVLESNVITGASRSAERASDAPATSTVVTAEQLKIFGIHKLDDALNFLSLGAFAHDRLSASEVGARGVALTRDNNSHVLVLLDGMVMNEQGGGAVFLHDVPMEVVDHIEVILGPGSVLYGSQAMLGVINVVTKAPKDFGGVHASSKFGVSPPMGSDYSVQDPSLDKLGHDNAFSVSYGRRFKLFGEQAGAIASLQYSDFKGPDFSFPMSAQPQRYDGTTVNLGQHQTQPGMWGGPVSEQWYQRTAGAYVKLDVGNWTANFRASTSRWASPQMDLFENAVGAYDDPANFDSSSLVLGNIRYERRLNKHLDGMARLYIGYSRFLRSRFVADHDHLSPGIPLGILDPEQCPLGPTAPCRKESYFLSRWFGSELQARYDWFGDGAFSTMVGVDSRFRTSAYEFVAFDTETGKSYGSDPAYTRWHGGGNKMADEYALGTYLQQSAHPWKFLALNAGVRVDFDSRIDSSNMPDAISPRVALIATPDDRVSLKLIYSKAFRAPSFVELYSIQGRLLPNPDGLKPEGVSSFEGVASYRMGAHTWSVSGFYADWQNLIELRVVKAQAPAQSMYENVPGIKNYGTNLAYEGHMLDRRLRLGLNATFAVARRDLSPEQITRNAPYGVGSDVSIPVAPSVFGNARASYEFDFGTVAVAAAFMGRRIADQAFYGADPSNITPRPEAPPQATLRAVYSGPIPHVNGANFMLGGQYAFSATQPYVVGPNQGQAKYLVETGTSATLLPVNRMSVFAGLTFNIDDGGDRPSGTAAPTPATPKGSVQ